METKRFTEYYFEDALRLAQHFTEKHNATMTATQGSAAKFPLVGGQPFPSEKLDVISVSKFDVTVCEVAFISHDAPSEENRKYRNRSLYRVLVGEEIERVRREKNISLVELAEKTGFRPHSLQRIEEGRWDIDVAQLGVILDALGVEIHLI